MWVARNRCDRVYHLFNVRPVYDEWFQAWGEPGYKQANDELTVQYLNTAYKVVTPQELGFSMDLKDQPIEIENLIKLKHPNKERKERTAVDRPLNKYLKRYNYGVTSKCDYFDGWYKGNDNKMRPVTECMAPWSCLCKGNKMDCGKIKYKWLASLSEEKRNTWLKEHEDLA
jgi:hypothetical protein